MKQRRNTVDFPAGADLGPERAAASRGDSRSGRLRVGSSTVAHGPRRKADPGVARRVRRVIAGDAESRAWLYDRFSTRLYRRLRSRYGNGHGLDAEELLQDTFLWAFQHDARVLMGFLERVPAGEQTETRLENHLWGLACGIASNRRRSLRRHPTLPWPDAEPEGDAEDPERSNVQRDMLARLSACLKRSRSRVYLYYKLRFIDGLTPEEISSVTGWSRKATYKLKLSLNAAVEQCAKRLGIG